jgi:hypothetical protein
MRDATCASTSPPTTAPNIRQRDRPALGVADVYEREHERADDGEDPGGEETAVDRGHRGLVPVGGAHREHSDDRREHADRTSAEREERARRPELGAIREDRRERRDAEDDRRDQRDLVRLEQVGRHSCTVADVVPHVVGDGGRVARVVFGNAGFDLSDEVRADVGRLREDAAADTQEQREQRPTEPEADQDRRARVLEDHHDQRGAEQAEAHGEHPGDAAGAERDLERLRHRAGTGSRGGADVAPHGEAHADEAGEARHHAPEHERGRAEAARLRERERDSAVGTLHRGRCQEHDDGERHEDHADRLELTLQVRHRAFLNRLGDLLHLVGALVLREHAPHEREPDEAREQRRQRRPDEDQPLTSAQGELLVTALSGEYVRHCSVLMPLV